MHELKHRYTERRISPWGGIKYFQKIYSSCKIREMLTQLDLPKPGSNRGYNPIDLVEGFMTSVVLGSRRLEHSGMLRMDEVIKAIWGWEKGMASASTFSRFLGKFDVEINDRIFPTMMRYILDQVPIKYMTIDIDSTVITRYGHQELAEKGYNPAKRGRRSHHPLLAFCDELKMVVNAWMRSGDSHELTDIDRFLKEMFTIVPPHNIGLIRGDVGFYSERIMSQLEVTEGGIPFIIKAKVTPKLMNRALQVTKWLYLDEKNIQNAYAEIEYEGNRWSTRRRIVIVRTNKLNEVAKPQLFKEYEDFDQYDYKFFATNTKWSGLDVHLRYNQRGDSENRIKELKYDYAIEGFSLNKFGAMEAAFRFILIAFNLMAIFKQALLDKKGYKYLSTIRFQCIAIGSYLVKSGRKKEMLLSAQGQRRHFLEHIFKRFDWIQPPFSFSNA